MRYLMFPFGPMFTPSRNCVSKKTRLPLKGLKSIVAAARSTASEITSCSVASRDLLMPQPADSIIAAMANRVAFGGSIGRAQTEEEESHDGQERKTVRRSL